ncbi:hypothetical protein JVT61DRAFT_12881 [Boletus reticuloceps]|uniref:Pentatricopeptide repeat-containing protein-mitochondrial domain-containing protein n=1 Tax=Boletus reticuloceps TaxID=495285 RepID=A0A8I2YV41_9AGAM|nr:hypothetical protein JVT61DRAFT_12881 [Boletus reticuloceps]
MVEPLAAAIKSRPSAARLLALALTSMARPARRPFPNDFFSPLPRQSKGKEKAVEPPSIESRLASLDIHHGVQVLLLLHIVALGLTFLFPVRNRLFMLDQVIPRRSQPLSHPSQRCTRRHSSSAARTLSSQTRLPQTVRPTHEPEEPVDNLRSLLTARAPFDPEYAWHLYMASVQADASNPTLTPREHLRFIQRLLNAFELYGDAPPDLPMLYTWGTRLEPVLRDLKSHLDDASPEIIPLKCFTAQVHAWLGDVEQASHLIREIRGSRLNHADRCTLLCVYRNILVLLRHRQGASCALDLLIREWKFLGPLCHTRTITLPQAASFRKAIHNILADISDGASLLHSRSQSGQDDRSHMGELLLETYCAKKLLHQAHALVLEMGRQQLPVQFHLQAKLTRLLAQQDRFTLAHEIFASMESSIDPRLYYATGLHLYARRGDVDRAELFFSKHNDNNWSLPVARCMLMHAYAVAGRADTVVELFHKFFPTTPEGGNFLTERPGIIHYTTVILAHAELANSDGIDFWLEKMLEAGCRPDGHVYSIILQNFARQGDVDSVAAIFDQMRKAEIKPDRVHYTSVITLLARRKDAVAAEAFYLQALHEGITPDRKMITSLMNAHVEAGSWEGVVRIFDYLRQSSHFRYDLSIEVYNTLLKAYVLIGTPFRVVLSMFRTLVQVGVRPDRYTYALVIQSACDAGNMNVAEELFSEMGEKAKSWGPLSHFDAYMLTIIMAGYVRQRSKAQTKACYEDMQRRGIRPSSVTYKQVLQAYANDRTEASLKLAESFLRRIMDADADDPSWIGSESRPSALGNLYSPLMLVYARKQKPEEVRRLFNGMLEAGGGSSLESLTIILDVHRRTNNIDVVRQLWPQIWELALRLSCANMFFEGDNSNSTPILRRRSNLLCMPLSIYIDALSVAGEHRAVLDAWTRAKAEGFSFDAHNWNHLAVALVRAGELDRAFEVLERVLIPYSRKGPTVRDPSPESPLVFDVMALDVDMPASDAPMRRKTRRAKAVKSATKMVGSRLESSTDFAHPLHILRQVIPGLSMWRPHAVTLQVLSNVLGHLQRGRLVQPMRAANTPPATLQNHANSQSQVEIASATLQRVYRNYPEAVRAVLLFERRQARR